MMRNDAEKLEKSQAKFQQGSGNEMNFIPLKVNLCKNEMKYSLWQILNIMTYT